MVRLCRFIAILIQEVKKIVGNFFKEAKKKHYLSLQNYVQVNFCLLIVFLRLFYKVASFLKADIWELQRKRIQLCYMIYCIREILIETLEKRAKYV